MGSDNIVIELKDIVRTFKLGDQPVHALDGVNLQIRQGEYVSIMGPSGSGKSTLLHALGLLDTLPVTSTAPRSGSGRTRRSARRRSASAWRLP